MELNNTQTEVEDKSKFFDLKEEVAITMIYSGVRICQQHYELSENFSSELFMYFKRDDNYMCVADILNEWSCFEDNGRVNLNSLPDPSLVRPCDRLIRLYTSAGMPQPHSMFDELDGDPSAFTKMVFVYRMLYDILYANKLHYLEQDQADHFTKNTSLFQLDDEITLIHR